MDLNEIKVFVKVAQAGSFSQAAKSLGMPNSTVSAKVSMLEKRIGVTLLQRTTRKLRLTEAGEVYFRRCLEGIDAIQFAETEVSQSQHEPQGLLKITAPVNFESASLVQLIEKFSKQYPKVNLEFVFSDEFVDLVADGVDVAIRAGELSDSGLISKKLGSVMWLPYASPAYLKREGSLSHPKELKNHKCIYFTPLGDHGWKLTNNRTTVTVPMTPHIVGNNSNLVKALCVAGNGIALLPTFLTESDVKDGKLVRVLPEWFSNKHSIHIVYPAQKFVSPKVRAFVDLAVDIFKKVFQE